MVRFLDFSRVAARSRLLRCFRGIFRRLVGSVRRFARLPDRSLLRAERLFQTREIPFYFRRDPLTAERRRTVVLTAEEPRPPRPRNERRTFQPQLVQLLRADDLFPQMQKPVFRFVLRQELCRHTVFLRLAEQFAVFIQPAVQGVKLFVEFAQIVDHAVFSFLGFAGTFRKRSGSAVS